MKSAKNNLAKIATAIAPLSVVAVKKGKKETEANSTTTEKPKKKQINPATLPPLINTVEISTVRTRMLATEETNKARAAYEQFVNGLDLAEYPGKFDQASFGDLLHVTPSLPTNKRKLDSLLNIDARVASVYQDAQDIYKSLLDKTETAKINDFAKRKKLSQKKQSDKVEKNKATKVEQFEPAAAEPVEKNKATKVEQSEPAASEPVEKTTEKIIEATTIDSTATVTETVVVTAVETVAADETSTSLPQEPTITQ